jgi:hypothetical protein
MTDSGSFRGITDTTVQQLHDYYKLPTGQLSPDPTCFVCPRGQPLVATLTYRPFCELGLAGLQPHFGR